MNIQSKEIIIFDLDGTLAESRAEITPHMAQLLSELLKSYKVSILSGASFEQLMTNVVSKLTNIDNLDKLILLPTCGASFYQLENNAWNKLYSIDLSAEDKYHIIKAIKYCLNKVSFSIDQIWGEQYQDKSTQVTFSALGNKSPKDIKMNWDADLKKRSELRELVAQLLPNFEVKIGGTTSLDITPKGIDKAFGIKKLEEYLKINKDQMLFVGDAIFPGGNDYAVKQYGVECILVTSPEDTMLVIGFLLN